MTHFRDLETGRAVNRTTRVSMREVVTDETSGIRVDGEVLELEHLRGPRGNVRIGALLTIADTVGGMCSGLAVLPRWVVSTNLMLRTVAAAHHGPFDVHGRALRIGRNSVVTEVEIRERGGDRAVVADGVLTSAVLEPDGGPPHFERPLVLVPPPVEVDEAAEPVLEFFGVRTVDPTTVALDITDRVRNPWGILHGGATAVLVDAAATNAVGDGAVATDAVLHFLRPGRAGPAVARATSLGHRPDGHVVRVEVVDAGAGDRVMAVAVCTVAEP